jgi:alkanesulfonate monooxygenase SsuD/methylene tetrahydromethanopterin reductase-like flavin-dependent oxidoreductase (luciferase family)
MNVLFFHLMPYAELPDDFRESHPSIWVDIDSRLYDPERGGAMYRDYLDELEEAAALGFDGVCVNEHHSNGYGMMPSPNLMASVLARNTTRGAVCVMGNAPALYDPPLRVAEEMAMLDCISGGRLIAGLPLGTPMDTCYAYGRNPSTLRDTYVEACDLVVRAWQEREPFAFAGRFFQHRYVNIWPRPIQSPRPPIWIPGGGSPDTWRMCGRDGYVYAALSYFGYHTARGVLKGYWAELERQGREPNPFQAGYLQLVGVAETKREALELYREPAEYFYTNCLHTNPRFAVPPGYATEESVRFRARQANPGNPVAQFTTAPTYDQILERGYLLVGTPDEVAERLRDIAVDLNIGQLMLLLHFGNMDRGLTGHNTTLFAERVLPQIRDLFTDRWEDHWWPEAARRAPVDDTRADDS